MGGWVARRCIGARGLVMVGPIAWHPLRQRSTFRTGPTRAAPRPIPFHRFPDKGPMRAAHHPLALERSPDPTRASSPLQCWLAPHCRASRVATEAVAQAARLAAVTEAAALAVASGASCSRCLGTCPLPLLIPWRGEHQIMAVGSHFPISLNAPLGCSTGQYRGRCAWGDFEQVLYRAQPNCSLLHQSVPGSFGR